jgi:quinol monooxygenase YgiN
MKQPYSIFQGEESMFARMTSSQISPDKADEAISIMENMVLPLMRQQKGFKNYCAFYDRSSGKAITVTVWETEADREASNQTSAYYKAAMARIAPLFLTPPTVENYEADIYS